MKAEEIIKKFDLDKTTWTFKGFHGLLFTFYYIGYGPLKWCHDYYGDQCKKTMFFVKNNYVRWYWPDDDMRRLRKLLVKKVNRDSSYLKKMRLDWEKKLRKFDKVLEKIDNTNLSKLNEKELFALYDEFLQKYMEEFGIVMTVQDAFSMYSGEFLEPYFQKIFSQQNKMEKFASYYPILMSPVEDSFISLEKKSRLKILKALKEGNDTTDLLKKHQKKFFWIRNNYAKQPVLNIEFFKEEIKNMDLNPDKELKKIEDELIKTKQEKEKMIKELNLNQEAINLIRITENFSYIQDERKKYVLLANHYQRLFIKLMAHKKNLPEKLIEYTVYPETKSELDSKKLKKRINGCVCIQNNKGLYIFEGEEVEKIHESLFGTKKEDIAELKGLAASNGKVKGTVKVVQKTHDLINFKQGDILISSMTRPEMVIAMKKAAAIVTDEGGITSHAAVVSRELKIPCIIGTKFATQVLKDGDLVEVDANKGVIKILKKK